MGAVGLLRLRYPLQMRPLLFFEPAYKGMRLTRIALSLTLGGVDPVSARR